MYHSLRNLFLNQIACSEHAKRVVIDKEDNSLDSIIAPNMDTLNNHIIRDELNFVLNVLCNDTERELLLKRFRDGCSYSEISGQLGITDLACRQRVFYLRAKIKRAM